MGVGVATNMRFLLSLIAITALIVAASGLSDSWEELAKLPLKADTRLVETLDQSSWAAKSLEATQWLTVQLDAVAPVVDLSDANGPHLEVVFTVYNPTTESVRMCTRDTPAEGMLSNLFVIQNPQAEVMEYRGMDVKRTEFPNATTEYVTLGAGEATTHTVQISTNYQLDGDGLYYIRVKEPVDEHIKFSDVMRTQVQIVVKGTGEHEERHLEREAELKSWKKDLKAGVTTLHPIVGKIPLELDEVVVDQKQMAEVGTGGITFSACDPARRNAISGWHADATHKINSALACTESSCGSLVDSWFGTSTTQSSFQAVLEQFQTMSNVKEDTTYVCQGNAGPCASGNTFAYVYPTDRTQQIYICDFTVNYPDYSEKVQTVIHELSHFNHIGNTNDNAYGESTCINLAQTNFQSALQTADNVGYFGKYANTCYQNGPAGYVAKVAPTVDCSDRYTNCPSLASNCAGNTGAGPVSTVCCSSCQTTSNDCSNLASGGGTVSSSRRRAPAPTPPANTGGQTDTASNCGGASGLVTVNGCSACCVGAAQGGGDVASVCQASCASSSGGNSSPVSRRRAPTPPPASTGGQADTAGNCASLIANNGCDTCCVRSTGGTVASVCAASCSSSSSSSSTGGSNTCRYANDGACDEPTYCNAGTDTADCASAPATTRTRRRRYRN